ncbi:T9SS type B sorting domain-containing protein [Croceitalea rosinachiae]|uniref:T9SS type B sorting domain-containing protein n=1 Tax=Croceitalea rosinachiae TaxID=3075596 RepID=A0ABU3ACS5_9FLAO|nr:T9SS type B sorting domain-containing protein [Croceitalea sp. F388]MDT0607990.1 T9SS type B sorting domain-containing protein [Croceitalea sp. F388]
MEQLKILISFIVKIFGRPIPLVLLFFNFVNAQDNSAPVVTAEGDQLYCPGATIPIVTAFDIIDVDDIGIDQFSIQISEGYQRGSDILRLEGTNLGVTTSWNDREGKLIFRGTIGGPILYADLIPAVQNVVFESSSDNPTAEKFFSLTVGSANYLPQTDHYYEYVPFVGISWDDARIAAENRMFFGLQGYLATITSQAEAQLSGEQASGTGWIGGSDSEQEGVWRWMTGPETGDVFWNGGINGTSPSFAFWNTAEPNNFGDEDYVHITAPGIGIPGSWNDLRLTGEPSGDYQPKGYVVEYGGTPGDPVINLSASAKLTTPKIVETFPNEICGPGTTTLEARGSIGELFWFESASGGVPIGSGEVFETPWLVQDETFYVLASVDGCLSGQRTAVQAIVKLIPTINNGLTITNCDEDGLSDGFTNFDLTQYLSLINSDFTNYTFTFHLTLDDAENDTNLQSATMFNNSLALANEVFFRIEGTGDYCYTIGNLFLEVSTTSFPTDFLFELETCDIDETDGIAVFDLEVAEESLRAQFPAGQNLSVSFFKSNDDAILKQNEILNTSSYLNTTPFSEMLFVRVDDEETGTCFGVGEHLLLSVLPLPIFQLENEYEFCTEDFVQISPLNPQAEYQYSWFNSNDKMIGNGSEINISDEGNYSVTAISANGCSSEFVLFTVIESGPPIFSSELIVVNSNEQTITIQNNNGELGLGNYEYALDSPFGPYQLEPIFVNVEPGLHTLYAVDLNGCGTDEFEVGIVGVPKFFTPNNDTVNDEMKVLGITENFYQSGNLFIYDRYGKLLAQKSALTGSWDGFYNGRLLPPSDYWYVLELVTREGSLERRNGHFTLKQ